MYLLLKITRQGRIGEPTGFPDQERIQKRDADSRKVDDAMLVKRRQRVLGRSNLSGVAMVTECQDGLQTVPECNDIPGLPSQTEEGCWGFMKYLSFMSEIKMQNTKCVPELQHPQAMVLLPVGIGLL